MKIAVMGAAGRMGRQLIAAIAAEPGCTLSGATEPAGSSMLGKDAGELAGLERLGVAVSSDTAAVIAAADAIVDFTIPKASVEFAELAARSGTAHIIGTTGFDKVSEAAIAAAARKIAIVKAGNMSLGVNLLAALTRQVAAALGNDFDIEIVEMHHRMKIDAPSGTALMLGEAAAEGRGISLAERSVRVRDGHTGPRQSGDIGFATLRGGTVVGDHTVIFAGEGERIELTHRATDRGIFARGAVKAAMWTKDRAPGLYAMTDVLGIRNS
ncbi:4-hydroxy-tetrahydrodipicolinate reductase [Hyphomicrobium sp.]|jgi:4-hydroxy-tetrahydrodipicolinate reductase|uniref:4-hydroxy-tetrahydrodipicolinate reductase n=1 Tax=Hyphomicrobium sp. TaxID=82 RepID=UPI002B8D2AB9|nr:4-hydroxy-tetrahydrodipicolinate reductase [Hyphomicrobium sp.]HVZ05525.1 4-hydroxy-tetrahydrodipicolinate reductase [Hyphomicrobium sp.]